MFAQVRPGSCPVWGGSTTFRHSIVSHLLFRASTTSLSPPSPILNSDPVYLPHISQMSGSDIEITEEKRWFRDGVAVDTVEILCRG